MSVRVLRGRAAGSLEQARREIREEWVSDPATGEPTPERLARNARDRLTLKRAACDRVRRDARHQLEDLARRLRGVS